MTSRTQSLMTGLAITASTLLTLSACSTPTLEDLVVGDCFNYSELTEENPAAPTINCAEEHEGEVYYIGDLEGSDTLTPEDIDALADNACYAAFEPYVGVPFFESAYLYLAFVPTEEAWQNGDRNLLCILVSPDGTLTQKIGTT